MKNQNLKTAAYLWGLSGILIAIGFIIHPPITAAGILEPIWVPDHFIILASLLTMGFALNYFAFTLKDQLNTLGWLGYITLSLSVFLFVGIVYFEISVAPILAQDLPEIFADGLRIGPLKIILPLSALLFILGHAFFGITLIKRKLVPAIPFIGLIVFSAPVALKPGLPDLVANIGALGYGLSAIYFTWSYLKTLNEENEVSLELS